jgi:transcriptional regulator with XRE-family HTH domain
VNQGRRNITFVTSIAERLKEARDAAGLSQPELAKRAGVSRGTIGNIEAGHRKEPRELLAIARVVGVNAEWLKTGKGPKSPMPQEDSSMHGWPLSPELLAALQNMDTKTRRRIENTIRGSLEMPLLTPTQETGSAAA